MIVGLLYVVKLECKKLSKEIEIEDVCKLKELMGCKIEKSKKKNKQNLPNLWWFSHFDMNLRQGEIKGWCRQSQILCYRSLNWMQLWQIKISLSTDLVLIRWCIWDNGPTWTSTMQHKIAQDEWNLPGDLTTIVCSILWNTVWSCQREGYLSNQRASGTELIKNMKLKWKL